MSRRRARPLLAATTLGLALLAGCGDDEPTPASEPSGGSTASEPTASEPTEGESTASEAAGQRMEVPVGSIALPEGWEVDRTNETLATSPSGRSLIGIYDLGPVGPVTVRQLGRTLVDGAGADEPELGFDVELDGETGFAVRETDLGDDRAHHLFGSVRDGQAVQIGIVLSKADFTLAEQQELTDEVLATYTWS